jgi:hypothetical protein
VREDSHPCFSQFIKLSLLTLERVWSAATAAHGSDKAELCPAGSVVTEDPLLFTLIPCTCFLMLDPCLLQSCFVLGASVGPCGPSLADCHSHHSHVSTHTHTCPHLCARQHPSRTAGSASPGDLCQQHGAGPGLSVAMTSTGRTCHGHCPGSCHVWVVPGLPDTQGARRPGRIWQLQGFWLSSPVWLLPSCHLSLLQVDHGATVQACHPRVLRHN